MRTDDDLTTLLRHGFTQATADLDPEPDLVRVVRRRYARARLRRRVVGVAVPAAVLAVGSGLALTGRDSPNHTPRHTAVAAPRTAPVTPVPVKPASYKLVAIKIKRSAPPNCPANARAPVGKSEHPAGALFFPKQGTCVFVRIDWSDIKPASAAPIHLEGYPGLYGTLDNGVRAIYAPQAPGTNDAHPSGGWVVLTMPADAPQEEAVRLIVVPANP
jgi:hypothetical protein